MSLQAASQVSFTANSPYYIVSRANGKYVNMYVDKTSQIKNKTKVNLYKFSGDNTQKFTFAVTDSAHLIQPYKAAGYTVNISSRSAGTAVFAWTKNVKNDEPWIIEKVTDGYTIRLKNKSSLYLTAEGDKLALRAKKTGNSQIFTIRSAVETEKKTESSTKTTTTRVTVPAPYKYGTTPKEENGYLRLAVPSIKQTDKRWKNKTFVSGAMPKCTIGQYGCLMTSVTAIMSYYDGTTYRPDVYYKSRGSVLRFTQVLPKKGKYKNWDLKKRSKNAGNMKAISGWINAAGYSLKTIRTQLRKGNPVAVGGKGPSGYHYVVVYGYKNGGVKAADYYIMDPSSQSKSLYSHNKKFGHTMYYRK